LREVLAGDGLEDRQPGRRPGPLPVPLHLVTGACELRLLNMVATFGTALDVTAAELVIDAFYPADPATAQALRRVPGRQPSG